MSFTNRLELSVGNEVLRPNEDRRLVSAVPLRDRMVGLIHSLPFGRAYVHCHYVVAGINSQSCEFQCQ